MAPTNDEIRTAIGRQAADWYTENRAGPLSPKDAKSFTAWLRLSPIHVREYLATIEVSRGMRNAGQLNIPLDVLIAEAQADTAEAVTPIGAWMHRDRRTVERHWWDWPAAWQPVVVALALVVKGYRCIALAPVDVIDIARRDQIASRYRDEISRELTKIGFTVVDASEYGALWAEERQRVGGFHDPYTGKADAAKIRASRARVFETVRKRYAVAAVVVPTVEVRSAPFWGGKATWDGVSEMVSEGSLLGAIFSLRARYFGALEALSLSVQILDSEGRLLFGGLGGIQLAKKFSGASRVPVAELDLFSDPAHDARAVELALRSPASSARTNGESLAARDDRSCE